MSCYHPKLMFPTGEFHSKSGKPVYSFVKDADSRSFVNAADNGCIIVPCGKCIGCRLDYSRRWADRMMLELETSKKALFVTLTYDDCHVHMSYDEDTGEAYGLTLSKRDCQLFMKMVRKKFSSVTVRFYASGEYGEKFHRPHLHVILFGLGIDDFPEKVCKGRNELGQKYYEIDRISECWHEFSESGHDLGLRGLVCCSDVSYNTMAYVARYVMKKVKSDSFDAFESNVQPEFSLMSRRPGIGRIYLEEHPDCLDYQSISVSTENGAKKIQIPKYFLNILKNKSEQMPIDLRLKDRYDMIIEQRKELANDRMLQKLSATSLSYLDQLQVEENARVSSLNALKRKEL